MNQRMILLVGADENLRGDIHRLLPQDVALHAIKHSWQILDFPGVSGASAILFAEEDLNEDAIQTLQQLKAGLPHVPVVCLVRCSTKETILAAFRSGADDVIERERLAKELMPSLRQLMQNAPSVQNPHFSESDEITALLHARQPQVWPAWMRRAVQPLQRLWQRRRPTHLEAPTNGHANGKSEPATAVEDAPPIFDLAGIGADSSRPFLQIFFLGKFRMFINQTLVERWPNRKARLLFQYLAYRHDRPVYRDVLMDRFWPTSSPESARNCLNVAIHSLRQLFHQHDPQHEYILFKNECYFINPEVELWLDVDEFQRFWRQGQVIEASQGLEAAIEAYEKASSQYGGDFLEEELYESWPELDRENLREIYLVVLDRLSQYYCQKNRPDLAARVCEMILEKDNCREEIHRRLMLCYYQLKQRHKAVRQFHKCREILQKELEVQPMRDTEELYQRIRQG